MDAEIVVVLAQEEHHASIDLLRKEHLGKNLHEYIA